MPSPVGMTAFALQPEMSAGLRARAKELRISVFNLWVFIYAVCVLYQAGDVGEAGRPLLIGTAYHGRDLPEIGQVAGFFVHQFVICLRLPPSMLIHEALAHTAQVCRSA